VARSKESEEVDSGIDRVWIQTQRGWIQAHSLVSSTVAGDGEVVASNMWAIASRCGMRRCKSGS
jgi:hypothetical protein